MILNKTSRGVTRLDLLCLAGFLVLTVVATWPVATDTTGVMFGFPGDTFDHVWMNWWYAHAWDHHIDWEHTPLIDAPVGKDFSQLAMQPTWRWSVIALTKIDGEIFTFNFLVLASFFLSGLTMYFLARHVGAARGAAFIAGAAFMLCPYHVWHSYQHLTLAAVQWIPLYLLALFRLRERPTVPRAVACGLVFAVVMLENYWYGGFMVLLTALFVIVSLIWKARQREGLALREVLCAMIALVVGAAAVTPWVGPIAQRSLEGKEPLWPAMPVYQRAPEDAAALAASPLDYVRPPSNHPLWGKAFAEPRFAQEKTIYVGIVILALAFVGLAASARRGGGTLFAAIFFAMLIFVAFNLSLAPFAVVGNSIAPMFRAYARLAVLAEAALCVLAAMGLSAIAAKTRWGNAALACAFALVVLDFAYIPAQSVTDVSKTPAVYKWLAEQEGDFIITEIPTSRFTNYDRFFQRIHHKRVLSNDRLDQVADLQNLAELQQSRKLFGGGDEEGLFRRFTARLAGYGVKYVIVHLRDPFPYNPVLQSFVDKRWDVTLQWTPAQIEQWSKETGAFREARRFDDDAVVYEVAAEPLKILIGAPDGRTIVIGGAEASGSAGELTLDILLQPAPVPEAEAAIVFESEAQIEEFPGLTRDGSKYTLSIPLDNIETLVPLRIKNFIRIAPLPPLKIKIISFTVSGTGALQARE